MFLEVNSEENPPKYRCDIEDPEGYKYSLEFRTSSDEFCTCGPDGDCRFTCEPYGFKPMPEEDFAQEVLKILMEHNDKIKLGDIPFRINHEECVIRFYTNDSELAVWFKMTWDHSRLKDKYEKF